MAVERLGRGIRKPVGGMLNLREKARVLKAINNPSTVLSDGTRRTPPEAVERQLRVLSIVTNSGYAHLSPAEIIGKLAKTEGLDGERIAPYLESIEALRRRGVYKANGLAHRYYAPLNGSRLQEMVRVLHEQTRERPINTHAIAEGIGFATDLRKGGEARHQAVATVTRGMEILEQMRKVEKHPQDSTVSGGPLTWIATEHKGVADTIPHKNKTWQLLLRLREGPVLVSDVMKVQRKGPKRPQGFADPTINLSNLVKSRMLRMQKVKRGNRAFVQYGYTPRGSLLMERQMGGNVLLEDIRKGILGLPIQGLTPHEERRYGELIDWLDLELAVKRDKTTGRGRRLNIRKITADTGKSKSQVERVRDGVRNPLQSMQAKSAARYLAVMEREHPRQAIRFKRHLEERGML